MLGERGGTYQKSRGAACLAGVAFEIFTDSSMTAPVVRICQYVCMYVVMYSFFSQHIKADINYIAIMTQFEQANENIFVSMTKLN